MINNECQYPSEMESYPLEQTLERLQFTDDFDTWVDQLSTSDSLQPCAVNEQLQAISPVLAELQAKSNNKSGTVSIEQHSLLHAQGVEAYLPILESDSSRQIVRFFSYFHDSGKGLAREQGAAQGEYNLAITEKALQAVDEEVMNATTKETVLQLISTDIIGRAVRHASPTAPNKEGTLPLPEAKAEMGVFLASLPEDLDPDVRAEMPAILWMCYMADITTYSSLRKTEMTNGGEITGPTEMDDAFWEVPARNGENSGMLIFKPPLGDVVTGVFGSEIADALTQATQRGYKPAA